MTKFKLGGMLGFAAGFYAGAMAGRQWFDHINKAIGKVAGSGAFGTATGKAKAVVDLGVERAKDVIEDKVGHGHNGEEPKVDKTWPDQMDPVVRP